jgi:hypothetical protein
MQHGHKVFLILPEAKDVPTGGLTVAVLPHFSLFLTPHTGRTLQNVSGSTFFQNYLGCLRGHELLIEGRQTVRQLPHGWVWQISICDNVRRTVCAQYANAYILHPPAAGRDDLAIKAILEFFGPDFEEPVPEPYPDWSKQFSAQIPGVAELQSKATQTEGEIARLRSELAANETKRKELEKWAEMLWLDGVPLQTRVSEALRLVGIPNESKDPTGHTQDLQGTCVGRPILFEVTGSKGSIGVEKGRQLLQWISQCDNPSITKGVLIGNAYRNDPPEKRPPTENHKIFVNEVEEMAQKFHFALLDVRELFVLVVRKLSGEVIKPEFVCESLQVNGAVRFDKG